MVNTAFLRIRKRYLISTSTGTMSLALFHDVLRTKQTTERIRIYTREKSTVENTRMAAWLTALILRHMLFCLIRPKNDEEIGAGSGFAGGHRTYRQPEFCRQTVMPAAAICPP